MPEARYNDPEIDVSERSVRQVKSADVARKSFQAQAAEDHTVTDSGVLKGAENSQPEDTYSKPKKTVSFADQDEVFEIPGKEDSGRSNKKSWSQSAYNSFVSFFKSIGINFSKMIQAWSKMTDAQIKKLESDISNIALDLNKNKSRKVALNYSEGEFNEATKKAVADIEELQSLQLKIKSMPEGKEKEALDVYMNWSTGLVVNDIAQIVYDKPDNVDISTVLNDLSPEIQVQVDKVVSFKKQQDVNVVHTIELFQDQNWTQKQLDDYMEKNNFSKIEKKRIQSRFDFWKSVGVKDENVDEHSIEAQIDEYKNKQSQRSSSDSALVDVSATHEELNPAQPDTVLIHASSSNVELNAPQPDIQQRSNTQNSLLADIQKGQSVLKPSVQRKVVQPQASTFKQQLQQSTETIRSDRSLDELTEEEEEEKEFKDDELGAVFSQVQQGVNPQVTSTQNQQVPVNTASAILNSPQSRKMLDVAQSRHEQSELKNKKDEDDEDEWS